MAAPLLAKSPSQELSQELTNILPKGIIKKVIPKKAVILINKEDLELPTQESSNFFSWRTTSRPSKTKK